MNRPVKKIVIAGGGTAGWMAAALLCKTFGETIEVLLVESDEIPTVGVGESTIPPMTTFHQLLGIDENELVSQVHGTFKLGIAFENWREPGHEYIHAFGTAGQDSWECSFIHYWLAARARDQSVPPYGEYCAELVSCRRGRFAVLPNKRLKYAYHLDAGLYAAFLRRYSEKRGCRRIEGRIDNVVIEPVDGAIGELHLSSGDTVTGDFFIDCTGFRALLIERALHAGYEDWSHWLPCDRAIAVQSEATEQPVPYTRAIAHDAGWRWQIPLQNRIGNGIVYSSRYFTDSEAEDQLRREVGGRLLSEPRQLSFRTGSRRRHWHKNCLALGLASGFLEPLESTSIHLIQRSLLRFVQLFPGGCIHPSLIDEFNNQNRVELEGIRDFIILHYKATRRDDTAFWRYCRNMEVPYNLQQRLTLFEESGRVFRKENELFGEPSWVQVMLGQGVVPRNHHPAAAKMRAEDLTRLLDNLHLNVDRLVNQLPSHQEYIDRYCKSLS